MVLLHLHCPSGAPLRYTVCHTACSSYGIRHGSFCVLHATSFITSSVPLHFTTCPAFQCSRPGNRFPASFIILMNIQITNDQTRFIESLLSPRPNALALPCRSQASPYHEIFANGHWVPFRFTTAYIHFSSIQSTRCQ
jgi:hypothetical protein